MPMFPFNSLSAVSRQASVFRKKGDLGSVGF
jgi:hypothetical protein